jgi:hypothetical protein
MRKGKKSDALGNVRCSDDVARGLTSIRSANAVTSTT